MTKGSNADLSMTALAKGGLWLAFYFCCNLGLTMHNKIVLGQFRYAYTLTLLHSLASLVGSGLAIFVAGVTPFQRGIGASGAALLLGYSVLYTLNIGISNASLQLVTLSFHQTVRAINPAVRLQIKRTSRASHLCLVGFGWLSDWLFVL